MVFTQEQIQTARENAVTSHLESDEDIFYEMCFCICSPQTKWESNMIVNRKLRDVDFMNYDTLGLLSIVKPVRFYVNKAKYLREAKSSFNFILHHVRNDNLTNRALRGLLMDNYNGFGMKTASHFVRNVRGVNDIAVIDTHVLKYFGCDSKTISKAMYLEYERRFLDHARELGVTPIELDYLIFVNGSGASEHR